MIIRARAEQINKEGKTKARKKPLQVLIMFPGLEPELNQYSEPEHPAAASH
jgi:hypothetical protein